jgi:tRNA(Ile)-lysidine synthase
MRLLEPQKLRREFPPLRSYLIGISGGRDSVTLLHLLVDLGYKNLTVCHLNHQLRGRASDADAGFVEKLAAKYDVDLVVRATNVRKLATKKKMSLEAAGRAARYSFFASVAKRKRCRTILLGHHADDLAETFLINLFRGAGPAGLSGIREIAERRVDDVDLTVVRPLLRVWRDDIDQYVRKHRLKFREDASNKDLSPLRNRVRRQIIPYLEKKLGRNIRQSIWRAAMIAVEEENWLDQMANGQGDDGDLFVEKLRTLPVALQRRTILKWLRANEIGDVGYDTVELVRSLLEPDTRVAKVNLPQDRHARRRAKKIFLE